MTKQTTSTFLRQWDSRLSYLTSVMDGLRGRPFAWNMSQGDNGKAVLAEFGITLVTATWLRDRGYVLNRGAKPVGTIYFGAPISRPCAVYVLECQAYLSDPAKLARVEAAQTEREMTKGA